MYDFDCVSMCVYYDFLLLLRWDEKMKSENEIGTSENGRNVKKKKRGNEQKKYSNDEGHQKQQQI